MLMGQQMYENTSEMLSEAQLIYNKELIHTNKDCQNIRYSKFAAKMENQQ